MKPRETTTHEPQTAEQKQELVTNLGSQLHDEWREPRKNEDGTFDPRIKKLKMNLGLKLMV